MVRDTRTINNYVCHLNEMVIVPCVTEQGSTVNYNVHWSVRHGPVSY
jgi:hypothetical protein